MTREQANLFVSALKTIRSEATDNQALNAKHLYPTWDVDVSYVTNDRVLYEDILYKVLQSHTSQADWTPTNAPSLFAKVLIPDENVVPEWEQPDSTNPYMKGDKVSHNGKFWVSTVDNNVWEPGVACWDEV